MSDPPTWCGEPDDRLNKSADERKIAMRATTTPLVLGFLNADDFCVDVDVDESAFEDDGVLCDRLPPRALPSFQSRIGPLSAHIVHDDRSVQTVAW